MNENQMSAAVGEPEGLRLRAVMFDLDGTLLHMDTEWFVRRYVTCLIDFAARAGCDAQALRRGFMAGVDAMGRHDAELSNEEAFWRGFAASQAEGGQALDAARFAGPAGSKGAMGSGDVAGSGAVASAAHVGMTPAEAACVDADAAAAAREEWEGLFADYFRQEFDHVGHGVRPSADAQRAVGALRQKGYPLVLATMPFFPREAVVRRLAWAGIDADAFVRITSYENSRAVKPHARYYAESLAAVGARGAETLMVGNNTIDDLGACQLGCQAFLVTDYLLNPQGRDIRTVRHGSMAEFASWAERLPACAHPATGADGGLVAQTRVEAALRDAGVAEGPAARASVPASTPADPSPTERSRA
ncbi:HAD family hydrolase [Eggerthellaceae bacterium zg-1084]|uniref:HAD family hydrolase n=1 Tax=Berryella wangjianweii TaxID=2734634 RepID=UPI001553C8E3|nr:HAD family hydrolase [Berryella wangjianweii]NPD31102.1 HAD family hydrolase [Berryella wangjianweii]